MCFVCDRISKIKEGTNVNFVRELETWYVVLGDYQRFKGYTLFLCKECVSELHFLESDFRNKYLQEMSIVAEAVYNVFQPEKLNYELLGVGNGVHMHWHIFPRRTGDTPKPGPVWRLPSSEMNDEKYRPSFEELIELKARLKSELDKLI